MTIPVLLANNFLQPRRNEMEGDLRAQQFIAVLVAYITLKGWSSIPVRWYKGISTPIAVILSLSHSNVLKYIQSWQHILVTTNTFFYSIRTSLGAIFFHNATFNLRKFVITRGKKLGWPTFQLVHACELSPFNHFVCFYISIHI